MNEEREILKLALRNDLPEVIYGFIQSIDVENNTPLTGLSKRTTISFTTYQDYKALNFVDSRDDLGSPFTYALVRVPK